VLAPSPAKTPLPPARGGCRLGARRFLVHTSVFLDLVVNVRLSDELHGVLVRAAAAAGRSLHSEILVRLDGRVPAVLPLRSAGPGEALPDLPKDSYPEGARSVRVDRRPFRPDPKGGSK
jgi:hypothetical protein